ncbi:MAG: hypothetical protein JSV10_08160 [Candidatus Zixiibacteriota bacterium]|nr:MAG: hypothetical protein JSV10_08160 [candidate division Zixibacteria bacterium]
MVTRTKLLIIGGLILCIVVFLLVRGQMSSPDLGEDKFVEVYVQFSLAAEKFKSDSLTLAEERQRILKQAGVTQDQMDDFVDRLNERPDEWGRVWERIVQRLEEKRQELKSP